MSDKTESRAPAAPFLANELRRQDVSALLNMVKATSLLINQLEAELRESGEGLRANEWDALIFLAARGPMRPAELLRLTTVAVSPGTLHAILARLEDRGLVERSPHPEHERGVLYGVTLEGVATIESIWPTVERHLVRRFAVLYTDDELEQLDELTSRIQAGRKRTPLRPTTVGPWTKSAAARTLASRSRPTLPASTPKRC